MTNVEIIHRTNAEVGEGPTWDAAAQELLWVDILRGEIWADKLNGSAPHCLTFDTHVGAVLPSRNPGEWLICTREGFARVDRRAGGAHPVVVPLATPLAHHPDSRFNDAKVSPEGRAFGGTMPYLADAEAGALYRLDSESVATPVAAPLRLANGLGWSPSGTTMYFIDSGAKVLFHAEYDLETGDLSGVAPLIEFSLPSGVLPDGMCVDDAGGLWVAIMGGSRIERYSPAGELDRTIQLPVQRPTSLSFAGPRLDTLIVTSLSYQLSEEQRREDPNAGSLLGVDIETTGPAATPWDPELIGLPLA